MEYKIKEMPKVALGTWQISDNSLIPSIVNKAFEVGYDHFLVGQIYGTEHLFGEAFKASGAKREDFWISTLMWSANFQNHAYASIESSLKRLQTDYVDTLILNTSDGNENNLRAFKEAIKARENGLIRSIGAANFSIEELNYLKENTGEYPKYLQIVGSVTTRVEELEQLAKENDLVIQAYSTIKPYYAPNPMMGDYGVLNDAQKAKLDAIAAKHNTTVANVMFGFMLSKGYVILPKTEKLERLQENLEGPKSVKFDDADLKELESMNSFSTEDFNNLLTNLNGMFSQFGLNDENREKGFLI